MLRVKLKINWQDIHNTTEDLDPIIGHLRATRDLSPIVNNIYKFTAREEYIVIHRIYYPRSTSIPASNISIRYEAIINAQEIKDTLLNTITCKNIHGI